MDERALCGRGGSGGGGGAFFNGRDNVAGIVACPLEWKEGQAFSDTGGPTMEY